MTIIKGKTTRRPRPPSDWKNKPFDERYVLTAHSQYIASVLKHEILPNEEVFRLAEIMCAHRRVEKHTKGETYHYDAIGLEARNKLVAHNMALVVRIANDYVEPGMLEQSSNGAAELLDLFGEGALGLIHAVDKFDPRRGNKFSTYATWWVNQAVNRFINTKVKHIHLPDHVAQIAKKLKQYGDVPPSKIAEQTGIDLDVILAIRAASHTLSYDYKQTGDDDEFSLLDMVEDTTKPYETIHNDMTIAPLEARLQLVLTENEFFVIRRIVLEDATLDMVAKEMDRSRERVRQIKGRGLKKLRELRVWETWELAQ